MTTEIKRFCRHCDEEITNPADTVMVAHELGNSGPGHTVWAHREHAHLVGPDPVAVSILARVLIAKALRTDT